MSSKLQWDGRHIKSVVAPSGERLYEVKAGHIV